MQHRLSCPLDPIFGHPLALPHCCQRLRQAIRHGGDHQRAEFDDLVGLPESMNNDEHVIDLNEALDKLASEDLLRCHCC
ncbi:hypothetical protein F7C95_12175 [Opitutia bacterium ISCC 51]|nr:hypothetical protein F7C95_12175 [Opitutae bacterium ISCC 51]QXD30424.1 hypothetical protein GA003_12105 [Opitutae bacterium ISCC 52]